MRVIPPFPEAPVLERPTLELSGPKLARAFETLVGCSDERGGIELYVEALRAKSAAFRSAFGLADPLALEPSAFETLCGMMGTVRRRVRSHLAPGRFERMRAQVVRLLEGRNAVSTTDDRIAAFCSAFPEDREHRWVRDLAAEILHNVDPERYPLMCRWVWDAQTNTGVIREIWHGDDVDRIAIDLPSRVGTYLMLREELSQFLSQNGVFRDMVHYVDLLSAQVYANYVCELGGNFLHADLNAPEDPMLHTGRLLGLDPPARPDRDPRCRSTNAR